MKYWTSWLTSSTSFTCVLPGVDLKGGRETPSKVIFLFLTVAVQAPYSIVLNSVLFSIIVVWYSLLWSYATPPCLVDLFIVWSWYSLLSSLQVAIQTLSSSVSFNQVSIRIVKSVFSSELVSIICSTLFFMELTLIVASLMLFDLFLHVSLLSFTWTRFLVLTLVHGIFLLRCNFLECLLILYFLMISIISKGKIQYLLYFSLLDMHNSWSLVYVGTLGLTLWGAYVY